MRTSLGCSVLCACVLLPCSIHAQGEPRVINVHVDPAGGVIRGTITNPLAQPLTAWYVTATDAAGRPLVSLMSDALLQPTSYYIPPEGSQAVEVLAGPPATGLVLLAAVRADGMEVGDLRGAFEIVSFRHRRARIFETLSEYLLSVDPATTPTDVYSELLDVVTATASGGDSAVLMGVLKGRAMNGTVDAWRRAADHLREQYQLGAVRYAALLERLAIQEGVKP